MWAGSLGAKLARRALIGDAFYWIRPFSLAAWRCHHRNAPTVDETRRDETITHAESNGEDIGFGHEWR